MNWPTISIGSVCLPIQQCDPSAAPDASFSYIDISSVDKDQKAINAVQRITGSDAPSRAKKMVKKGDTLVSMVRPNLNAVALVPKELDGEIASTGFAVLRPDPSLVNERYLFYRSRTNDFISILVSRATGASYPAVSDGIVRRVDIPLPPPKEQQRIVDILDQADSLRKQRAEADKKAEHILPALFYKMFGDPVTNPRGLRKVSLGKLIKVKSGEFLPAKNMAAEGQFPVYGGNGINGYHDKYMFDKSKVVLGRVGVYCGVVHYSKPKAWVTDNALYVSEKIEDLDDRYLVVALQLANLNQYAGRAGQPLISGSRIYPVEILVPSKSDQLAFAQSAITLLELDAQRVESDLKLNQLWDVLMQRAFTGQLTAKWREAHMKELLVEMEEQARLLNQPIPDTAVLMANDANIRTEDC